MTNETPRIYVACLAAYNNGILHGEWIDATEGEDAMYAGVRNMLKASPMSDAEEWAIHDYEGFGNFRIDEYQGIEGVHRLASMIAEHQDVALAALTITCGDMDEAERLIEEFIGQFDSLAEFGEHILEEIQNIPSNLAYYIDYEAFARDMELEGSITSQRYNGKLFIFWNT